MASKPVVLTAQAGGAVAYSPVWVPDMNVTVWNVGFGCVVSGTVTYTVQHTYDDPTVVASPTWWADSVVAAQTANKEGSSTTPVMAYRVLTTAGTGSVTVSFVQAGVGFNS